MSFSSARVSTPLLAISPAPRRLAHHGGAPIVHLGRRRRDEPIGLHASLRDAFEPTDGVLVIHTNRRIAVALGIESATAEDAPRGNRADGIDQIPAPCDQRKQEALTDVACGPRA